MFAPGWKNKDSEKAIKWVNRRRENTRALSKAAQFSTDPAVRAAAVAKITDKAILLRLVKAYCYEAVSALQDTETLFALALSPTFWGGEDRYVSWYNDVGVVVPGYPGFSSRYETWKTSLDVAKGYERLKPIRLQQKQYGFAQLAFLELRRKGSDAQIEGLLCSRYEDVRHDAIREALKRHPERAESYAKDETLSLFVRIEAIERDLEEHPDKAESYVNDDTLNPDMRIKAVKKVLEEYPDKAEFYANDDTLSDKERIEAVRRVTDPEQRRRYCKQFGTHEWKVILSEAGENGDHWDTYTVSRCIYCGEEKRESSRRRL